MAGMEIDTPLQETAARDTADRPVLADTAAATIAAAMTADNPKCFIGPIDPPLLSKAYESRPESDSAAADDDGDPEVPRTPCAGLRALADDPPDEPEA
jgi:hypothetical protein